MYDGYALAINNSKHSAQTGHPQAKTLYAFIKEVAALPRGGPTSVQQLTSCHKHLKNHVDMPEKHKLATKLAPELLLEG